MCFTAERTNQSLEYIPLNYILFPCILHSTGRTRYRQVTTYLDAYRQRLPTILFYNQDVQRYVFGVWECQGEPLATSNNTQVTSPTAVSQWLEFTGEEGAASCSTIEGEFHSRVVSQGSVASDLQQNGDARTA